MHLYEPEGHEPLTSTVWDEPRARAAIDEIVDATLAAREPGGLWRLHRADADDGDPLEPTTVWVGAAGVIWALADLRPELELADIAELAVARYLERPDLG